MKTPQLPIATPTADGDELLKLLGQGLLICEAFEAFFKAMVGKALPMLCEPDRAEEIYKKELKEPCMNYLYKARKLGYFKKHYEDRFYIFIRLRNIFIHERTKLLPTSDAQLQFTKKFVEFGAEQVAIMLAVFVRWLRDAGEEVPLPRELTDLAIRFSDEFDLKLPLPGFVPPGRQQADVNLYVGGKPS